MVSPSHQQHLVDETSLKTCYARYASDTAVAQYCDAHYGPDKFGVANFPAQLARLCSAAVAGLPQHRALDLGCAVGRASFELATRFDQVVGIDFSSPFISVAQRLRERGRICYRLPEEGDLVSDQIVSLSDLNLAATATRTEFYQGNALQLGEQHCGFDLILAANLIDRLAEPGSFLGDIHRRLVTGGILAIASPYNWLEKFTPRRHWLGGGFRSGAPQPALQGIREKLNRHFSLVGEPQDVEFVLRESARTYRHGISELTFWRRTR